MHVFCFVLRFIFNAKNRVLIREFDIFMLLCRRFFIDISIMFRRVMTFAYNVSFVVDTYNPNLSILPKVLLALLDFLLILLIGCEVYLISVLILFAFPTN